MYFSPLSIGLNWKIKLDLKWKASWGCINLREKSKHFEGNNRSNYCNRSNNVPGLGCLTAGKTYRSTGLDIDIAATMTATNQVCMSVPSDYSVTGMNIINVPENQSLYKTEREDLNLVSSRKDDFVENKRWDKSYRSKYCPCSYCDYEWTVHISEQIILLL